MFGHRTPPTKRSSAGDRSNSGTDRVVLRQSKEWEEGRPSPVTGSPPEQSGAQTTTIATRTGTVSPKGDTQLTPGTSSAPARVPLKPRTALARTPPVSSHPVAVSEPGPPSPSTTIKASRLKQARASVTRAKTKIGQSRNLRNEIREDVTNAIDELYTIIKALDAELRGLGGLNTQPETARLELSPAPTNAGCVDRDMSDKLLGKLEEHSVLLKENARSLELLRSAVETQTESVSKMTYASVAAGPPSGRLPGRAALHSVVITSKEASDTGDEVMDKVRRAIDAKGGGIEIERVRKGRDRKIIMGCRTVEQREKIKDKINKAGKHLVVEEVKNKDPMLVLRGVLSVHTDEDILEALRNQNGDVFRGLSDGEARVGVKFRRRARNPHTNHIVLTASPAVWRRALEKSRLWVDMQAVPVEDQSPLVQCTRCLGYGHGRRFCKEAVDICCHCGGPHLRAECPHWLAAEEPQCRNCVLAKMAHCVHSAFSGDCPIRKRMDEIARASVAYC